MRFVRTMLMMGAVTAVPAFGNLPSFDKTGNGLLNGTYYFREVLYSVDSSGTGNLGNAYAQYGTINFNGAGGYTVQNATLSYYQTASGSGQQSFSASGAYTFAANGYGYFTSPLSTLFNSTFSNYGLLSNGVLIASSTESGINTLFIAVPTSPTVPAATNSSFQGNYQIAGFLPGNASASADLLYQLNPDGAGNLGTVNMNGYFAANNTTASTQTSTAKYAFTNGAGIITFPTLATANFYSGQEYLYISPDHNFVFGGSPQGFDMFVGVKTSTGAVNFNGLYYEGGIDFDATQLAAANGGFSAMDTFYGTFNALNTNIVGDERIYYALSGFSDSLNYTSSYPSPIANGTYTVTNAPYGTQYYFGNGGAVRIGFGVGPSLGINVALQAPAMAGSGVYLNPSGVVNAASYAPFTAGVSPGEIVVLYGTNLAPGLQSASSLPLPNILNGVQVTVNGVPAPIYYVSATQVSVVVPYSAAYTVKAGFPIASFVLTNASGTSNAVTEFFNLTTPGVFTQNASGLGAASIFHATSKGFSYVTVANPAQPGETVVAYLSGLGATVPSVMEGTASSSSPLANTSNGFDISVNGTQVCGTETTSTPCPFVGLAPGTADVYQVNIPIPSAATSGNNSLEIFGPDSDNFQVSIPVGNGTTSASDVPGLQPDVRSMRPRRFLKPDPTKPRTAPCLMNGAACTSAEAR